MKEKAEEAADPLALLARAFCHVAVFSAAFYLFYVQAFAPRYVAELQNHIDLAREIGKNPAAPSVPHPGFHLMTLGLSAVTGMSLEYSAILLLSAFVVVIFWMIDLVLSTFLHGLYSRGFILLLSGTLMLTSAICFPPFSANFYLGQGTPNFWAVPTLIVVKPFALLGVLMFISFVLDPERRRSPGYAVLLSLVLLVSVVMKPNFALVFFPAAFLFLLIRRTRETSLFLKTIAMGVPTALLLLLQYRLWYHDRPSGVALTFFGVWSLYTPNVPVSVLLGIAFPLSLLAMRFRSVLENDRLLFCWLLYGVSFLQFAFLAEKEGLEAGNFSWGYNIALWLLFLFATVDFFRWLKEDRFDVRRKRIQAAVVSSLFSLHVTSGVAYLIKQMLGLGYK